MHRKKEKHLLNLVKIERKANQLKSRISLCWKRSKEKRKINRQMKKKVKVIIINKEK